MNLNWSCSLETLNSGQNRHFFVPCDLEIWRMTLKTIGHLFHTTLSFCIISKPWVNSNWSNSLGTLNSGQNRHFFVPCDLEIWRMTLKNNRTPLLCCFKLCASFRSHWWIQSGVTVRKRYIWVKIDVFFSRVTLKFDRWPWNNRAPLLCCFKLCAWLHSQWWIQSGVTVRKRPIWVKIDWVFFWPCDL